MQSWKKGRIEEEAERDFLGGPCHVYGRNIFVLWTLRDIFNVNFYMFCLEQ